MRCERVEKKRSILLLVAFCISKSAIKIECLRIECVYVCKLLLSLAHSFVRSFACFVHDGHPNNKT